MERSLNKIKELERNIAMRFYMADYDPRVEKVPCKSCKQIKRLTFNNTNGHSTYNMYQETIILMLTPKHLPCYIV